MERKSAERLAYWGGYTILGLAVAVIVWSVGGPWGPPCPPDSEWTKLEKEAQDAEAAGKWSAAASKWKKILESPGIGKCPDLQAQASEHRVRCETLAEIEPLRQAAAEAQAKQEWKTAEDKWNELGKHPRLDLSPDARREAEENARICAERLTAAGTAPAKGEKIDVPPPKSPPPRITPEELQKFYPVGRRDRHLSMVVINGRGTHEDWGLKREANFSFVAKVETETEIADSNPATGLLVVRLRIKDSVQNLAVTKKTLELSLPDAPILAPIIDELDQWARQHPVYAGVRRVAEIARLADPNAKRSLTWMQQQLKKAGVDLPETGDLRLLTRIGELAGAEVELVYQTDFGVKTISRESELPLTRETLERLAQSSGILGDFVISTVADLKEGEEKSIRATDVPGIAAAMSLNETVEGEFRLVRGPDNPARVHEQKLGVRDGKLVYRSDDPREPEEAIVRIESGELIFDGRENQKLVQKAIMTLDLVNTVTRKDFLLFGAERIRDVQAKSYYEARRLDLVPAANKDSR